MQMCKDMHITITQTTSKIPHQETH